MEQGVVLYLYVVSLSKGGFEGGGGNNEETEKWTAAAAAGVFVLLFSGRERQLYIGVLFYLSLLFFF